MSIERQANVDGNHIRQANLVPTTNVEEDIYHSCRFNTPPRPEQMLHIMASQFLQGKKSLKKAEVQIRSTNRKVGLTGMRSCISCWKASCSAVTSARRMSFASPCRMKRQQNRRTCRRARPSPCGRHARKIASHRSEGFTHETQSSSWSCFIPI